MSDSVRTSPTLQTFLQEQVVSNTTGTFVINFPVERPDIQAMHRFITHPRVHGLVIACDVATFAHFAAWLQTWISRLRDYKKRTQSSIRIDLVLENDAPPLSNAFLELRKYAPLFDSVSYSYELDPKSVRIGLLPCKNIDHLAITMASMLSEEDMTEHYNFYRSVGVKRLLINFQDCSGDSEVTIAKWRLLHHLVQLISKAPIEGLEEVNIFGESQLWWDQSVILDLIRGTRLQSLSLTNFYQPLHHELDKELDKEVTAAQRITPLHFSLIMAQSASEVELESESGSGSLSRSSHYAREIVTEILERYEITTATLINVGDNVREYLLAWCSWDNRSGIRELTTDMVDPQTGYRMVVSLPGERFSTGMFSTGMFSIDTDSDTSMSMNTNPIDDPVRIRTDARAEADAEHDFQLRMTDRNIDARWMRWTRWIGEVVVPRLQVLGVRRVHLILEDTVTDVQMIRQIFATDTFVSLRLTMSTSRECSAEVLACLAKSQNIVNFECSQHYELTTPAEIELLKECLAHRGTLRRVYWNLALHKTFHDTSIGEDIMSAWRESSVIWCGLEAPCHLQPDFAFSLMDKALNARC